MISQTLLDAFQTMWGPFPEPVLLVAKDRTVLAVNDFAREVGVSAEVKCYSLNPEAGGKACKQCKANLALNEHRAVCSTEIVDGKAMTSYWIPLKEEPEIYVHFGIGAAEMMRQAGAAVGA